MYDDNHGKAEAVDNQINISDKMRDNHIANYGRLALRCSWVAVAVNIALSLFKLAAGVIAGSGAMISDAAHSASDVLSTFIVILGVKLSSRASDECHPYGHERQESIAALALSAMLMITGLGIGFSGIKNLLAPAETARIPGAFALAAAVASVCVQEAMFRYTRAVAKKISSDTLLADAWHRRSDALSSIGSFAGILGARLGFPMLDPLASVIICGFIIKVAADIFLSATGRLTDKSGPAELEHSILSLASVQPGVRGIDKLRTRQFGNRIFAEIEISVDGAVSLTEAHSAAHLVHDAVELAFPQVKHLMVHVNPVE